MYIQDIQDTVDLVSNVFQGNSAFCPFCGQGFWIFDHYYLGGLQYWECICIDCIQSFSISEPILPLSSGISKRFYKVKKCTSRS